MSVASDLVGGRANPTEAPAPAPAERWRRRVDRAAPFFELLGIGWLVPCLRMAAGESAGAQGREVWGAPWIPLCAVAALGGLWAWLAPKVQTSFGALLGPAQVWEQAGNLWADHRAEREKEAAFYARQQKRA